MGDLWLRRWTVELYIRDRELGNTGKTANIRKNSHQQIHPINGRRLTEGSDN